MDNCYGYIRVITREQKEDRQLIAKKTAAPASDHFCHLPELNKK